MPCKSFLDDEERARLRESSFDFMRKDYTSLSSHHYEVEKEVEALRTIVKNYDSQLRGLKRKIESGENVTIDLYKIPPETAPYEPGK